MPKIRSVKPSFFMSRAVKRLTDKQKLVWQGLWPNADDEGRMLDEPGIIVGQLWALSLNEAKLDVLLTELHRAGRVIRYEVAGEGFIQVTNWHEHQKVTRPVASLLPPCIGNADAVPRQGFNSVGTVSQHGGKGKERKGKEGEASTDAEPPLFCSTHLASQSSLPCPLCGDARRVHEAWQRAQKTKPTVSGIVTDPDCEQHPGRPLRGCDRCAEEAAA
jgi:hypothetical protein